MVHCAFGPPPATILRIDQVKKYLRSSHRAIGVFIAPAVLFFALSGALQTLDLHEAPRGSSYKPPTWIVRLSQIHKKQTATLPARRAADPAASSQPAHPPAPASPPKHNTLPLKVFFLLVAGGLFASSTSGIYMAYQRARNRLMVSFLLVAGVLIPILAIWK